MSDKIKRAIAARAALAALALGGAAIANATSGGGSDAAVAESTQADHGEAGEAAEAPDQPGDSEDQGSEASEAAEHESATGEDAGDSDGHVSAAVDKQARAAAEQATGGVANGDVEPAEPRDPVEDPNDQPTPKGAAYEVEIEKGGQALKVFLDSSLKAIEVQQDAG